MGVLIKYCVCFDKCLLGVVKCVLFVLKLTLSQISQILPKFTFYFYNNKHIFINTDIAFATKHTNFIKINTGPVKGPKCSPNFT